METPFNGAPMGGTTAKIWSQAQHALGFPVCDLLLIHIAERQMLQEVDRLAIRLIGRIHRKQQIVHAQGQQRAKERRCGELAATGDDQVLCQILRRRLLEAAPGGLARMGVEAAQPEGSPLRRDGRELS